MPGKLLRSFRTLLAAAALTWASAAHPATINVRVPLQANLDGSYQTAFPCTAGDRSNCSSAVGTLFCTDTGAPSLTGLITGTSYSENARAYFTGTNAATATLAVVTVSGSNATTTGWSISGGDNLAISSGTAGSGSLMVTGTASGSTVNCSARNWSRVSAGTDTTAPTVPTGLSVTLNGSNQPVLTFDAPCDPQVSGSASGLSTYTVTRNATPLTPVSITGGGQPAGSPTDIGAVSPAGTTSNTNGADYLEVSEGAVGSTADRLHFTSTSVTGDFTATAQIESFANVTVTYAKNGIMARDGTAVGARNVFGQMRPGTFTGMQYRSADGGATTQASQTGAQSAPGYIQLKRVGDTFTVNQSANGANWITTTPATTVLLPSTLLVGLATSSESAGNPITTQYRKLCIRSVASITYTDTTASAGTTYTYTVHATDAASNSSAESASVSITTGGNTPDFTVKASGGSFLNTTAGITSAIAAAAGADKIIEFQTATPGGSETWNASISCTSKDHWRIRVRDGDTVRLSGAANALIVNGCNYWIVQGNSTGKTGLEFGDMSQWVENLPSSSGYSAARQIDITGASHAVIRNLTTHGGTSFVANLIDRTSTLMLIDNIDARLHGTNCPPNGSGACSADGGGDLFETDASYSIVQNSTFQWGGHNEMDGYCHHCIFRDNDFNGDWTAKNTGSPGYRVADLGNDTSNWHTNATDPNVYGPRLFERNFLHTVNAVNSTHPHTQTITVHGTGHIIRQNYIYDDLTAQGFNVASFVGVSSGENESRLHLYNNTLYNTQGLMYSDDSLFNTQGPLNCREYRVFNNIAAITGQNGNGTSSATWTTSKCAAGANLNGYPNGLKGSGFDSNIINGSSTNKKWLLIMPSGSTSVVWGDNTTWPDSTSGYIMRNQDVPTTFVNAAAHTAAGFALAGGSNGIGTARQATTVTNAGTNTTLNLVDPYWFWDGWGIDNSALGIPAEKGDWIGVTPTSNGALNTAICTRIQSINYATGDIVVSPAVTHVNGSNVWPAGDGATCQIWGNQGASQ